MTFEALFHMLEKVSAVSVLVPLSFGFIGIKPLNKELRVLLFYLVVCACTETISFMQVSIGIHNYLIKNIFTVLECSSIVFIFLTKYESIKTRKIIAAFYVCFLALAFVMFIFNGRYDSADSALTTYEAWFIIALSLGYFFKLIKELNVARLTEYYFAWLNTAFFLYFCMSFFVFLFYWYLDRLELNRYSQLYTPHLFANIAFNLILAKGIWTYKHR